MGRKTIVVADDEPAMANAVKEMLESKGFLVFAALDGKSAIDIVTKVKPDLVILDIMMPQVQGYDVCRFLRDQWELKNMKILILSSMASEFDLETARAAGADSYITKPFGPEGLYNEVNRLLSDD